MQDKLSPLGFINDADKYNRARYRVSQQNCKRAVEYQRSCFHMRRHALEFKKLLDRMNPTIEELISLNPQRPFATSRNTGIVPNSSTTRHPARTAKNRTSHANG
jgi:hypothetical protein